jgi:hypothetical protein
VFKASKETTESSDRVGTWVYVFGGFDKKSIDSIERIKVTFSQDPYETRNGKFKLVTTRWELLKNITMMRSVECCGVAQMSEYEVLIFGGLQKGCNDDDENE